MVDSINKVLLSALASTAHYTILDAASRFGQLAVVHSYSFLIFICCAQESSLFIYSLDRIQASLFHFIIR